MAAVLSAQSYARLLKDVGALVEAGRSEAEAQAGHVLAVTYWKVGARIGREGLSERAGYGDGVVGKLADALGLSQVTLRRALRFAKLYDAPPEPGLAWAHYQELIAVADAEAREFYAARALSDGWTKRVLHDAIAARTFVHGDAALVAAQSTVKRPEDASYLYRCDVKHVIDADTLVVHLNLGFDVIRVQQLRLARVDAPEAKTEAGKEAAHWVRERLARALSVVARTEKPSDAHGRYVAHVFYSADDTASNESTFRKGNYLNAELVERGLAVTAPR